MGIERPGCKNVCPKCGNPRLRLLGTMPEPISLYERFCPECKMWIKPILEKDYKPATKEVL